MSANNLEEVISLCKRRGFVFSSSEAYGGLKGTFDLGPLGVELKKNIRHSCWKSLVYDRDDIEGLECSLLSHPLVFKYSGHEAGFYDMLQDCKQCKSRLRSDHLKDGKCPNCGSQNLTIARPFMQMMKTNVGPIEDTEFAYLRPETAQSTYLNFKNVLDATSRRLPFGIAQHGRSFRCEITPKTFFRMREFEQAEMQFFVAPKAADEWFENWKKIRLDWWVKLGIPKEKLRFHDHEKLAHYAKAATDIEYLFPWGFDEVEGIHNRQDFDLGSHTKNQYKYNIKANVLENKDSTVDFSYSDVIAKEIYIPYVIETAAGLDRAFTVLLIESYTEEVLPNNETRLVLKLNKELSPVKVAIIPLKKNDERFVRQAEEIKKQLTKLGIGRVMMDNSGNIGKSYRRHDEIGTPLCVTVDFETFEQNPPSITVRDRDTMCQKRIEIKKLDEYIMAFFK